MFESGLCPYARHFIVLASDVNGSLCIDFCTLVLALTHSRQHDNSHRDNNANELTDVDCPVNNCVLITVDNVSIVDVDVDSSGRC